LLCCFPLASCSPTSHPQGKFRRVWIARDGQALVSLLAVAVSRSCPQG
jgi:hypothetical protein